MTSQDRAGKRRRKGAGNPCRENGRNTNRFLKGDFAYEEKNKFEFIIDSEFQSQIPALTDEEFQQLEENILSEGEVLSPLIVWGNILVDGHNRYKILQQHPEIPLYHPFDFLYLRNP